MNNNRLIKGDAAIPLHPKGWRPLAASSWNSIIIIHNIIRFNKICLI